MKHESLWCGKPLSSYSKDQLIEIIERLGEDGRRAQGRKRHEEEILFSGDSYYSGVMSQHFHRKVY